MENWLYSFTSTAQFYGCCKLILDDSDQIKTATLNLSKRHLHRLETVTPSKAWEHLLQCPVAWRLTVDELVVQVDTSWLEVSSGVNRTRPTLLRQSQILCVFCFWKFKRNGMTISFLYYTNPDLAGSRNFAPKYWFMYFWT